MQKSGAVILIGFLSLPGPGWGADETSTPKASKQIVGEWQGVKGWETTPDMGLQFDRDGTFKVTERTGPGLTKDNKKIEAKTVTVAEGRYTIEGKQLTMVAQVD